MMRAALKARLNARFNDESMVEDVAQGLWSSNGGMTGAAMHFIMLPQNEELFDKKIDRARRRMQGHQVSDSDGEGSRVEGTLDSSAPQSPEPLLVTRLCFLARCHGMQRKTP